MKVFLLLAMILPLALSTSRIAEMQVHTATWPGSGIEFQGKNYKLLNEVHFTISRVIEYLLWGVKNI